MVSSPMERGSRCASKNRFSSKYRSLMKRNAAFLLLFVVPLTFALLSFAEATTAPLDSGIDLLFRTRGFEQVAIAPDGLRFAWVEKLPDGSGDTGIFVGNSKDLSAKPQQVSASREGAGHDEGHVTWSPDGRRLAFLSDAAENGQLELYVS